MNDKAIQIKNVIFSYQQNDVLKDISLDITKGKCILLCGESGCGKTSVTKLINGLIPHFQVGEKMEGEVLIFGESVAQTQMYQLARNVGSVFQNPKSQFFNLDTDSELAFVLENRGMPGEEISKRINEVVTQLAIEDLTHRSLFAMSGGEKQLLAFAAVYAGNPDIYVLDEPSSNLDEGAMERLRKQIQYVCNLGKTVIIAEHRLAYLSQVIDYAVYMKDGKIVKTYDRETFLKLRPEQLAQMGLRNTSKVTMKCRCDSVRNIPTGKWNLEVRDLVVKRGKKTVFSNVNFGVNEGEIIGIIGHNGAGKSTLLRCLCGLEKETSGEILLKGRKRRCKERTKEIYMVMQDVNHQIFGETVWDECEMIAGDVSKENIEKVLEQFDLIKQKERHPFSLSGGQKQRLVVATAVLGQRKILVLDEPTSGLDYGHMREVGRQMHMLADLGYMILIVTHDVEFINEACDRCIVME